MSFLRKSLKQVYFSFYERSDFYETLLKLFFHQVQ